VSQSKWFPTYNADAETKFLLFCFPYSGGGSMAFGGWRRQFPSEIGVYPVVYPGREGHWREPCRKHLADMIDELKGEIRPLLTKPFAFFGHSLGALIAFELARALQNEGKDAALLFVSAHRPPRAPLARAPVHLLEEHLFIEKIMEYGGTPPALFADPELKKVYLPILQADFTVWETYRYAPHRLLQCPIYVFGGLEDSTVDKENLISWQEETENQCHLQLFEGGHFFLKDSQGALIATVKDLIINAMKQG
jgi:medium-chain acyl-[acyl-carrier-protein] hydrolase